MFEAGLALEACMGQGYNIYLDALSYSATWFQGRSISSPGTFSSRETLESATFYAKRAGVLKRQEYLPDNVGSGRPLARRHSVSGTRSESEQFLPEFERLLPQIC
jgi:hypothetical protein